MTPFVTISIDHACLLAATWQRQYCEPIALPLVPHSPQLRSNGAHHGGRRPAPHHLSGPRHDVVRGNSQVKTRGRARQSAQWRTARSKSRACMAMASTVPGKIPGGKGGSRGRAILSRPTMRAIALASTTRWAPPAALPRATRRSNRPSRRCRGRFSLSLGRGHCDPTARQPPGEWTARWRPFRPAEAWLRMAVAGGHKETSNAESTRWNTVAKAHNITRAPLCTSTTHPSPSCPGGGLESPPLPRRSGLTTPPSQGRRGGAADARPAMSVARGTMRPKEGSGPRPTPTLPPAIYRGKVRAKRRNAHLRTHTGRAPTAARTTWAKELRTPQAPAALLAVRKPSADKSIEGLEPEWLRWRTPRACENKHGFPSSGCLVAGLLHEVCDGLLQAAEIDTDSPHMCAPGRLGICINLCVRHAHAVARPGYTGL